MAIISLAIESGGTSLVFQYSTRVFGIHGYFDKPSNSATLPLIEIYDSNDAGSLPSEPKFKFIPDHDRDKDTAGTFDLDLHGTLFLKGIVVVVGSFVDSTGSLYITHD